MEVLHIDGGHRFHLKHGPNAEIRKLKTPRTVAFSPRGLKAIKPKVLVKEGDSVSLGQALAEDKRDARIRFLSPAAGLVQEVRYGSFRTLEAVVIAVDHAKERASVGKKYRFDEIVQMSANDVEQTLLLGGLWGFFDTFPGSGFAPLREHASQGSEPLRIKGVHINLVRTEAHWPDPLLVIDGYLDALKAGIVAMSKLSSYTNVYVPKGSNVGIDIDEFATKVEVGNKYPSEHIGVQAFYNGGLSKGQCVMGATAELAVDVGHWFLTGQPRTERLYCLAGNAVKEPMHYLGRTGMAVGDLTDGALLTTEDVRLIAGGLFSGYKTRFQDYLSPKDLGLQAMVEDKERIPLVFFRLGKDRLTTSRMWLSGFKPHTAREATTSNNGEERACIQCGYCVDVCPVSLMPNLIMKASLTKDIEKMEWLSINDCVGCGLCTFVCPSKIELGKAIDAGMKLIEKEG